MNVSIEVSYTDGEGYKNSTAIMDIKEFNQESQKWYRTLQFSLPIQSHILNITVPDTYNYTLTLEFTWLHPNSVNNNSITANMTERIKTHLYRWTVLETNYFVVDYDPSTDLVVRGYVYHLNWSYVGTFSVSDSLNISTGTYYVLIDTHLRTGEYTLLLTDEKPNITDLYYTATATTRYESAGANGFQFLLILLSLLSFATFLKRSREKNQTRDS